MMDDLRNHDPSPSAHESAWMATDPMSIVVHLVALAGIAIAIGLAGSQMNAEEARPATVAEANP